MSLARVGAALAELDAALTDLPVHALSRDERLRALDGIETHLRKMPTHTQRITAILIAETTPKELGAKSWPEVLGTRLRITRADARRRLGDAECLGPRTSITGQPMGPLLGATAAAQSDGAIGAEHVRIIRATMDALPSWVDVTTREQAERDLVRAARGLDPDTLRKPILAKLAAPGMCTPTTPNPGYPAPRRPNRSPPTPAASANATTTP